MSRGEMEMAGTGARIGEVVDGRYRILRELGAGGMGTVYEAEHVGIGKRVAFKTLHREYATSTDLVRRFEQEARAATAIGNEHIVDVTDLGRLPDGTLFLVMELLQGRSLAEEMADGPMPVGRAVRIARQICDALQAAHAKGIVHRDLKPENVFLTTSRGAPDFVKVLDFGISKMRKNELPESGQLTRTGVALGTPAYMSPEQAMGAKDVDGATDVWSLGVLLYEMLAGRKPFEAEAFTALLLRIMADEPAPLASIREDVPAELADVVHRCLAKKVADRVPSMAALSEALAPFASLDAPPKLRTEAPAKPARAEAPTKAARATGADDAPANGTGLRTRLLGVAEAQDPAPPPPAPSDTPVLPSRKPPFAAIAGGVAGLALAGIVAAVVASGGEAPSAAPASAPAGGTESAGEPHDDDGEGARGAPPRDDDGEPARGEAAAAQPAEVRVRIRAVPADARITIDGVAFPNPMDAQRPRSLEPVTIRIEREGYRPIERIAIFDSDQTLDFELSREVGRRGHGTTASGEPQGAREASEPARTGGPSERRGPRVYEGSSGGLREEF